MPPIADASRFRAAIERIDALNRQDPRTETVDGTEQPSERVYAERMTRRLEIIAPDAPEAVRLAARAQHIGRWTIPRDAYPLDRAGYLKWRSDLARFHAEKTGKILREVGYDEAMIERVQALLRKEKLKSDPDTQLLEDAICCVFLEHYFADFARKHDEEKLLGILRRTWKKMSPRGREAALELDLDDAARALIDKALAPESS